MWVKKVKNHLLAKIILLVLFTTFLITTPFTTAVLPAKKTVQPDLTYQNIEKIIKTRNWQNIIDYINQLQETEKEIPPNLLSIKALAYRKLGDYYNALLIYKLIINKADLLIKPFITFYIARGYEETNNKDKAFLTYKKLYNKKNISPLLKPYVIYGMARTSPNDELKITYYQKLASLKSAPKNLKRLSYKKLLNLYIKHNLKQKAITTAVNVLENNINNKTAILFLIKNKSLIQKNQKALVLLGKHYFFQGRYQTTLFYLKKAQKDTRAKYYMAFCYYKLKKYSLALKLWKDISKSSTSPYYIRSSITRLYILSRVAYKDTIKRHFYTLLKRFSTKQNNIDNDIKPALLYYLAKMEKKDKNSKQAYKLIQELITFYPKNKRFTGNIIRELLWKSYIQKDYKSSVRYAKLLTKHFNSDYRLGAFAYYWLGQALISQGNIKEAKITWKTLATRFPLSFYTSYLVPKQYKLKVENSDSNLARKPQALEKWGFLFFAAKNYLRQSPPDYYRASLLLNIQNEYKSSSSYAEILTNYLARYKKTLFTPLLKLAFPKPFEKEVLLTAKKVGIKPALIWALMRTESRYDKLAVSYAGAVGLMQLMPQTAYAEARRLKLKQIDLYDPYTNIYIGAFHLKRLINRFKRLEWAISAYNAGAGNTSRWIKDIKQPYNQTLWIENIPFDETRYHVKKTLSNLYFYENIYK